MVLMVGWLARDLAQHGRAYRMIAGTGIVLTSTLGLGLTVAVHEPMLLQPALLQLASELRVADPTGLARQLTVLYDGALAQSRLDRSLGAVNAARDAANALVEAALGAIPA